MKCENCQRREAIEGHLLCGPCAAEELGRYDTEEDA